MGRASLDAAAGAADARLLTNRTSEPTSGQGCFNKGTNRNHPHLIAGRGIIGKTPNANKRCWLQAHHVVSRLTSDYNLARPTGPRTPSPLDPPRSSCLCI